MFAGHLGAALGLKATGTRTPLGALVCAALLLDLLLWALVLAGVERVEVPTDFQQRHYLTFVFPYSHGLTSTLGWTVAGLAITWALTRDHEPRAGLVVAAAIASHWILDLLVHVPDLPLVGATSPRLGLGLWHVMPVALAVETAVAVGGTWLYLRVTRTPLRAARGLVALLAAVAMFTIIGGTVAPPPPSATALAASSLVTCVGVIALAWWLEPRFL